jgi:hypothetical protein
MDPGDESIHDGKLGKLLGKSGYGRVIGVQVIPIDE